eukprot:TRINITY_DN1217_c2_g1_i3.p1 TRINITY_DN1217_c2_g1~~TRINITY_DN1217_c2_g1_i3.p1  ORF type:complete len:507 (+),score=143.53 TRINITY_DN1217_c2_g1_i3:103-1623(+)
MKQKLSKKIILKFSFLLLFLLFFPSMIVSQQPLNKFIQNLEKQLKMPNGCNKQVTSLCGSTQFPVEITKPNFELNRPDSRWLVLFYVPWCRASSTLLKQWSNFTVQDLGFCKDNIDLSNPNYNFLPLCFSQINCETHQELCYRYHVNALPTIKFFQGDFEYEFLPENRNRENIVNIIDSFVHPKIQYIKDENSWQKAELLDPVYFYLYSELPRTNAKEWLIMRTAFTRSATNHANLIRSFFWSDSYKPSKLDYLNGSRLAVVNQNHSTSIDAIDQTQSHAMKKYNKFISNYYSSVFQQLTKENAFEFKRSKKKVVILITEPEVEIKNSSLITKLAFEKNENYKFCFLDSAGADSWIKKFDVDISKLPAIIIWDVINRYFAIHQSFNEKIELNVNEIEQFIAKYEIKDIQIFEIEDWNNWIIRQIYEFPELLAQSSLGFFILNSIINYTIYYLALIAIISGLCFALSFYIYYQITTTPTSTDQKKLKKVNNNNNNKFVFLFKQKRNL